MAVPELVYILVSLLVWAGIVGGFFYVVTRGSRRARERDRRLQAIEEKLDRLLSDERRRRAPDDGGR